MLIGEDYPKIEFVIGNLRLLEPNGTITDVLMAALSFYLAFSIRKLKTQDTFSTFWVGFFILHGAGAFFGALGHALFLYWGLLGKIPTWFVSVISIYCIEKAFIYQLKNNRLKGVLDKIAIIKIFLVYGSIAAICMFSDVGLKPERPFLPVAINTIIGVIFSAGFLAHKFSKEDKHFRYFYWGVLTILPSAFFFLLKINPIQWFDKNDVSHLLMCAGIILFYIGIKKRSLNI